MEIQQLPTWCQVGIWIIHIVIYHLTMAQLPTNHEGFFLILATAQSDVCWDVPGGCAAPCGRSWDPQTGTSAARTTGWVGTQATTPGRMALHGTAWHCMALKRWGARIRSCLEITKENWLWWCNSAPSTSHHNIQIYPAHELGYWFYMPRTNKIIHT